MGDQITATVSIMNRPAYHGKPAITGLTTITPKIVCSRTPSGVLPFHIQVSACETTHDGATPENAYMDLHYEWDFGDTAGTEEFIDHFNMQTVNANDSQTGPEAAYIYRTAGTYAITLTVKGKDENGDIVSTTTTTLLNVGQYYIHNGGATGGTYTLTINGETTSAIAFNASMRTVVAALHALASIDSSNCRYGLFNLVELYGNLAGTTITFTGDFSGLTGTTSTAIIRTETTSASASSVTVSDTSGLTAQYFDSNYDGSNGAGNGTESRPYTAFSSFETFLEAGGSRVAWVKRGSTFTMNSKITFDQDSQETVRVLAYGTGANPVFTQTTTSAYFNFELTYGSAGTPSITFGDIVFSGIDVVAAAAVKSFFFTASTNGTAGYAYARCHNVVVDQCVWSSTVLDPDESGFFQSTSLNAPIYNTAQGGTTSSVTLAASASSTTDRYKNWPVVVVIDGTPEYSYVTAYNGTTKVASVSPSFSTAPDSNDVYVLHGPFVGSQFQGFHTWRTELDGGGSNQVALIQSTMGAWCSLVGDSIAGGTGSLTFDHDIYQYTTGHNLIRYVAFGAATKNFCINGNAAVHGGAMRYTLYDGCDFTGTKNAIDMSNTDNIWTGHPDDGYWDDAVIQFCKLHSGGVDATEQNGIVSYNLREVTVRYCYFWDNGQSHIGLSNTSGYPWQPKLYVYHCCFYGSHCDIRGTQAWYLHNNTFHSNIDSFGATAYCLKFYTTAYGVIDQWDADGNIWYNDQTTNPFYNVNTGSSFTFATWQAAGNDAAGSLSNPLWHSPADGQFVDAPVVSVDWPSGFTSLEYSTNNGSTWSSYTDAADVSLGTYLTDYTTVLFRANPPAQNGTFTVYAASSADNIDLSSETDSAVLTGSGTVRWLTIQAGSNVLVIQA